VTTIRVEEREALEDGSFAARVAFDSGLSFEVSILDPADAAAEALLAWYFEST
jgi:hypothetical protein